MAKVAVYHPWIYLKGGAERTLINLVRNSRHDWTILTSYYAREDTFPEFHNLNVRVVGKAVVNRTYWHTAKSILGILFSRLGEDYDAILVSSEGIGDLFTLFHRGPFLCYCHTPLKVVSDPETRARYFEKNPGILTKIKYGISMPLFLVADRRAWKRYSGVFANSKEVQRRIDSLGLADRREVSVLHPAVDIDTHGVTISDEGFFLVPGRIKWTKNIETAIRGFLASEVGSKSRSRLVVAGFVDSGSSGYYSELIELTSGHDNVEFVVDPSDSEMRALYATCHAVLFPAPNEDWGIVVLEAMTFGKPVIAVNKGGPAEIIRHGMDGILVSNTATEFATEIDAIYEDVNLYTLLSQNARGRANDFSWEAFCSRMDDEIDHVLSIESLQQGKHVFQ